jgi:hypothetical protein
MAMHDTIRTGTSRSCAGGRMVDARPSAAPSATPLCLHCQYYPASERIFGYCSWDCHDADDEEEDGVRPSAA